MSQNQDAVDWDVARTLELEDSGTEKMFRDYVNNGKAVVALAWEELANEF